MIATIDVEIQAANPNMPLYPWRAFKGSNTSLRIRNVPKKIGTWQITSVDVQVEYPDNTILRKSAKLVGGVWVATLNGSTLSGLVTNGYSIIASGIDEDGNAIGDYILGKGDAEILDSDSIIEAGIDVSAVKIYKSKPSEIKNGDCWFEDDILVICDKDTEKRIEGFKPNDNQLAALNSGITKNKVDSMVTDETLESSITDACIQLIPKFGCKQINGDIDAQIDIDAYKVNAWVANTYSKVIILNMPNNEDNKMRDAILVIDATIFTPELFWNNNYYPKINSDTDFACEKGINVYSISEYIPNKFVVTRWLETTSGKSAYNGELCFKSEKVNSSISMSKTGSAPDVHLSYSTNGITWSDFIVGSTTVTLANVGDVMYLKAKDGFTNITFSASASDYNSFVMTGKVAVSGNIQTLLNSTDVPNKITYANCYGCLFRNCTSLTQAPALPATSLADNCYDRMFYNCTSLTQAPALPATSLADNCYAYMFYGCTSLTQAPSILPATTLANNCYQSMFSGCKSIKQAPELPATTLANSCYYYMFYKCANLTQAPALPATRLANNCYAYMFYYSSLTQAPELPATSLADNCYRNMFEGCCELQSIDVNFEAWNPSNATNYWVKGDVSPSGTFTCPADLPEEFGDSRIPTGWTVVRK